MFDQRPLKESRVSERPIWEKSIWCEGEATGEMWAERIMTATCILCTALFCIVSWPSLQDLIQGAHFRSIGDDDESDFYLSHVDGENPGPFFGYSLVSESYSYRDNIGFCHANVCCHVVSIFVGIFTTTEIGSHWSHGLKQTNHRTTGEIHLIDRSKGGILCYV